MLKVVAEAFAENLANTFASACVCSRKFCEHLMKLAKNCEAFDKDCENYCVDFANVCNSFRGFVCESFCECL